MKKLKPLKKLKQSNPFKKLKPLNQSKELKIFLSWSGLVSKKIATILHEWLPKFHENIDPFISTLAISGKRSVDTIANELYESNYGIFCFTRTNIDALWMFFEGGAISKIGDKAFVSPVLFNIFKDDLIEPIQLFHARILEDKDDMLHLIYSVFTALFETKLTKEDRGIEKDKFDNLWPEFIGKIREYKNSDSFLADEMNDVAKKIGELHDRVKPLEEYDRVNFLKISDKTAKIGRELAKRGGYYTYKIESEEDWNKIKREVYLGKHEPLCTYCKEDILKDVNKAWYCDNCRNFYHDTCKDIIPKHKCEDCNEPLRPIRKYLDNYEDAVHV